MLVFGQMETRSFVFSAFGHSKEEVKATIFKEWNEGAGHEFRVPFKTVNEMEEWYGIRCYDTREIPYGKCMVE